jgi:hypothetical protein
MDLGCNQRYCSHVYVRTMKFVINVTAVMCMSE